jgi:AcrR family transcriptional regulator
MTMADRRPPAGAAVLREDITSALRQALLEELAAVGYGRLSIEAVARRAGIAKTAVYRRWSSKLDMVLELVTQAAGQRLNLPDTGSLSGDIELALRLLERALRHPLAAQIVPDLLAEAARNPRIETTLRAALHRAQQDVLTPLVQRAVDRGELTVPVDADLLADLVIGPLYWHLAVARQPLPRKHIAALAAVVTRALLRG